jgi:hypothetical protein
VYGTQRTDALARMTLLTLSLLVSLAALLAAAFAVWHMRMRVRRLIDARLGAHRGR